VTLVAHDASGNRRDINPTDTIAAASAGRVGESLPHEGWDLIHDRRRSPRRRPGVYLLKPLSLLAATALGRATAGHRMRLMARTPESVAVAGLSFWQGRYGGDPNYREEHRVSHKRYRLVAWCGPGLPGATAKSICDSSSTADPVRTYFTMICSSQAVTSAEAKR